MRRPTTVSVPLLLALCLALPSVARASDTSLLRLVPDDAAALWSWRSTPGSERLEQETEQVLDTLIEARFDQWTFDALQALGLPEGLMAEARGVRNVLTGVGGLVPWRELCRRELVLVHTLSPVLPGHGGHGWLLLSRPDPRQLPALRTSLAGLLGALAGVAPGAVRYDIVEHEQLGTPVYQLTLRGPVPRPLLQVALVDDVLLAAVGGRAFEHAGELLAGRPGARLIDSPRYRAATAELAETVNGRMYLDVPALTRDADELAGLLADRSFGEGPWQSLLGSALDVAANLDTLAAGLSCQGDRIERQVVSRFTDDAPPVVLDSLARSASGELLGFVPADVIALTERGAVDLVPAWHGAMQHLARQGGAMDSLLWAADVGQAAMDLYVDRDLLPWLGAEHVAMTLPSRANPSARELTDSVVLFKLEDRAGAASCLRRIDGVLQRVLPPLADKLNQWLTDADVPYRVAVEMGPAEGAFAGLRRLELKAGPFPIPPITYGLMGNLLVLTTSERALSGCLAVAAGEEDGIETRPLLAAALSRNDLCSLELRPVQRELEQTLGGLMGFSQMLQGLGASIGQEAPEAGDLLARVDDLLTRVTDVLQSIDFLDQSVTTATVSADGRVRRETTTLRLLPLELRDETPLALGSR